MPSWRHKTAMLSSPRRPDNTIRIFSSAEYRLRVLRRMSRTTFSAGSFLLIDFCLIFVPFGHYDEPEILPYENPSMCPIGADVRHSIERRPHRYDSYLPYVLDVAYYPSATCPRFDQALLDIFRESSDAADMARHCLEFIGYTIQPRRDIAAWFMLRGKGRNGKTKLMETIEQLINKKAIYSDRLANIETSPFMVGALAGKLLLIDDDIDTGTKLPDGFLKKVSERKLMTGQVKFKACLSG